MKNKILGISMAVLVLFCALAATVLDRDDGAERIHQHLTARGPDAGCDCD